MAGPNDHTVFAGPNEAKSAAITGVGFGQQHRPNAHTAWATGPEPSSKPRAVDMAQGEGELRSCEKCSFKTKIEDDFKYHTKKVGGLMKCERQRQAYNALVECSACKGQGETATGLCSPCMGSGKVRDPRAASSSVPAAAAVDADVIAAKVAEAINPALNAIADALRGLRPEVTISNKEKKPRKGKARGSSRVDRRGTASAGPAPVAPVEPQDQPVADPPSGPEAAQ